MATQPTQASRPEVTQPQPRNLLTSQTMATHERTRAMLTATETITVWDAPTESWRTVTVPAEPAKRATVTRTCRPGRPVDRTGLSDVSPLPSWWRDTAYAPSDGLADMRSHVAPAAIKTRRPATVVRWGDAGSFAGPDETF